MEAEWVIDTLRMTVNRYGKSEIINSDQDSQFTSDAYVGYVKKLETVRISMDGKSRVIDNLYIERFFRTIKYEKSYLERPETEGKLYQICAQFIQYYNERRDHSSVGAGGELNRTCAKFIQYCNERRDHSSVGNIPPMVVSQMAA